MRRNIFLVSVFVVLVMFVQLAEAQLINYDRREKRRENKTNLKEYPKGEAAAQMTIQEKVAALMASLPETANRTERLYDRNRDGKLQENEIERFLSDIISSVERRGQMRISSELLRGFDNNNDGIISKLEASDIKKGLD